MSSTPSQIFSNLGLWQWWTQNGGLGTNPFNGTTEKGIDYANTLGTPIGAIASGTVVGVQHNNNSINDIVTVLGSSGLWLYQHINSSVQVGQSISVGTVVGTQNGVPTGPNDPYSTGSHIEVRYSPTYNPNLASWYQSWVNPLTIFQKTANSPAGGNVATVGYSGATGSTGASIDIPGALTSFFNPLVTSFEGGVTKFGMIAAMGIAVILMLYMGVSLITGKDVTDAGAYAAHTNASHKATLEKLAMLAA